MIKHYFSIDTKVYSGLRQIYKMELSLKIRNYLRILTGKKTPSNKTSTLSKGMNMGI